MKLSATDVFALPDRLSRKADPALVAADEQHFAAIAACLDRTVADLSDRLDAERRNPGGSGQEAMDRDLEIHRLTARLRTLRRFGLDLCLGRMVHADGATGPDGATTVHVGRLGLTDGTGRRLLVDWRSPAAEPFFAATHADPMGLASRRRYRWTGGRVTDYWDEVFTPDGLENHAALDDQSAFVASLGASRSDRMRDVLGTIAADQDTVIRAGSGGVLVVDGGPGTGKTVVALHRSAYLLHADPRLRDGHGGILFVGPSRPYLAYVSDVLPSLGEDGVRTCMLSDLVPEGATAPAEADPRVAALKADARMVAAVDAAVEVYEEPPTEPLVVSTPWADVRLEPADWAEAFDAVDPGTPHNEAREQVLDAVVGILLDRFPAGATDPDGAPDGDHEGGQGAGPEPDVVRTALLRHGGLHAALGRSWPMLDATDVVGDLWSVPAYLRHCAPWLGPDDVRLLRRADDRAWTDADLPLLDAARRRLGDADAARLRRRRQAVVAADRARMDAVVDDLVAADDSEMLVMSMLRGPDLRAVLDDGTAVPAPVRDPLAGPFAHVVVDEAQELTDAQWQMVLARCPSRSLTVVGDRAQARHGFAGSWTERLHRNGFADVRTASLTINYRTPAEVMVQAEPVIRAVLPDANVPVSVRSNGIPVTYAARSELDAVLDGWLAAHDDGIACVIGDPAFRATSRVRSLAPQLAKGLEFDLVVLVDPQRFGTGIEGAVDHYVAMTRATERLVVLSST